MAREKHVHVMIEMAKAGKIPLTPPLYIDEYSKLSVYNLAGTVTTKIFSSSHYYILVDDTRPMTRQERLEYKLMPNGNIRGYDPAKSSCGISEGQFTNPDNPAPTVKVMGGRHLKVIMPGKRIRKLTERECFRLMDLRDSDIDKIQNHQWPVCLASGKIKIKNISKTHQYKLAGNGIVVACMVGIFYNLFCPEGNEI